MAQDNERAGLLAERVIIERWHSARDEAGDDVGQWHAVDEMFADVQPDTSLTTARAGEAARSGQRWRVRLRWRDDVDLAVRLRWNGRVLSVLAIATAGGGRSDLELLCKEQGA